MSYGRSHYVLGYLIVTISHNWPVLLALLAALICAILAWQQPSRRRLAALYGAVLVAVAYEYQKHILPRFVEATTFLTADSATLYRTTRFIVEPLALAVQAALALGFLLYALVPRRRPGR